MDVSGDLRSLAGGVALYTHVAGAFAEQPIDVTVDSTPGSGEQMAKHLFESPMADTKNVVLSIVN